MARGPNLTQFHLVETQAEHILELFRVRYGFPSRPPVPVQMMAENLLNLRCETRKLGRLSRRALGALDVENRIISVDQRCNAHQYVFAIAHEMGHWVLHREQTSSELDLDRAEVFFARRFMGSARGKTKRRKARLREIEANRFAGALLMPSSFLFPEADKYDVIDARALSELAKVFQVSIEAMLIRVKNLSRHWEWSGPRIDSEAIRRLASNLAKHHKGSLQATYSGSAGFRPSMSKPSLSRGRVRSLKNTGVDKENSPLIGKSEARKGIRFLIDFTRNQKAANCLSPRSRSLANQCIQLPIGDECACAIRSDKEIPVKRVVDYLRRKRDSHLLKEVPERPFVIEFAGTPNAGKDTLIAILADYLRDVHGYGVKVIDESVKFCPIDKHLEVDRLYSTLSSTVSRLLEVAVQDYDFVIVNRGIFDRLAFLRMTRLRGDITMEQERILANYLSYDRWLNLVDIVFVFLISPNESIQREHENKKNIIIELAKRDKRTIPRQRILNHETLSLLNASYREVYEAYGGMFREAYLLDFADSGDVAIAEKVQYLAKLVPGKGPVQLPFRQLSPWLLQGQPESSRRAKLSLQQRLCDSDNPPEKHYSVQLRLSLL